MLQVIIPIFIIIGIANDGTGIKATNQEFSSDKLEKLEDEKIIKLIQQELAGTEKERKRAKLKQRKESKVKVEPKVKGLLDPVNEEAENRPSDIQRSVSDVARIKMLDKKSTINHKIEETKKVDSSLNDTIQDDDLPENDNDSPSEKATPQLPSKSGRDESEEPETDKLHYNVKINQHDEDDFASKLPGLEGKSDSEESKEGEISPILKADDNQLQTKDNDSDDDFQVKTITNRLF